MIVREIGDLFTLYGDFDLPEGEVAKAGDAYAYDNSVLQIESKTEKHPDGIHVRRDTVKNVSPYAITLTTALSKFVLNGGEYEVYTQYNEHICERLGAWQNLVTGVYGMSDEIRTNQDVNPFVAVFNNQNGRGIAFHIMAESAFEYRVRRENEFLSPKLVTVELGIKSENFAYTLAPNETLALPEIIYYTFKSKLDMDAYKLHRYWNETHPVSELPIIYNSWMSHFDMMSYDMLLAQLERARDIGCEYFTVDAGWFGETQKWWDVVGDWREPEDCGMEGKLSALADKVREYGLKFGLWFEIERSSKFSNAIKEHPEYYISPTGPHAYIDFANPDACEFIYSRLKENIDKYGIEFIKFDLNAPLRFDRLRTSFIEYYRGYLAFLKRIKSEYPSLHLECCASGGGRMSLSNAPYFDSFWMSDNHGIYPQLEIFKSTLIRMPSRMLETWATIRSLEHFTPTYPVGDETEKILLSSDASWIRMEEATLDFIKSTLVGGPIGISCDLTQVSDKTLGELGDFIKEYKSEQSFFASSECRILCDTESLSVLQFNDRAFDKIKIYVYTKHSHQDSVTVYPVIEGDGTYQTDGAKMSASELEENGIEICAKGLRNAYSATLCRI